MPNYSRKRPFRSRRKIGAGSFRTTEQFGQSSLRVPGRGGALQCAQRREVFRQRLAWRLAFDVLPFGVLRFDDCLRAFPMLFRPTVRTSFLLPDEIGYFSNALFL